jgi:hypothetical protein
MEIAAVNGAGCNVAEEWCLREVDLGPPWIVVGAGRDLLIFVEFLRNSKMISVSKAPTMVDLVETGWW